MLDVIARNYINKVIKFLFKLYLRSICKTNYKNYF